MAGIALLQLVRPGAPIIYGDFTTNVDIKSGAPAFGTAHTKARYETAFYPAFLHDRRNAGTWQEAGSEDIVQRAYRLWQEIVTQYEEPEMDTAVKQALADYIKQRMAELKNVNLYD